MRHEREGGRTSHPIWDLAVSVVAAIGSYGLYHATGNVLWSVLLLAGMTVAFLLWLRRGKE